MANELRLFQDWLGGRLTYAMPAAATVVTDGVSNSSTTITSATAAFTPADVGATITGTDLPAAVYIAAYVSATQVTLSAAATGTGSARTWTINRHLTMHSAALAAMSVVGSTQHMLCGLDPDGMAGAPEVVMVTKHDSAATWAQIARAQEGTTARAHTNSGGDADWIHGAFATDLSSLPGKYVAVAGVVDGSVATAETTTSDTYTDLATAGPAAAAAIGSSGRALVTISCQSYCSLAGWDARMNFAVSGATTRAAQDVEKLQSAAPGNGYPFTMSRTVLVSGLTPGVNTFTAKYMSGSATNTATFAGRTIIVVPL